MPHIINSRFDKVRLVAGLAFCFVFLGNSFAMANVSQIKLYKAVFPDSQPKCLFCHVDKLPKKDEGLHEHNAYGKKVLAIDAKPTEETYKKVGAFEAFDTAQQTQQDGE